MKIDDVVPQRSVEASSPEEIADVLKTAAIGSQNVVPAGGGTALGIGNVPARVDVLLETGAVSGILDYQPTDLMVSVRAGTTIAELSRELAAHGQELPLDIPFPEQATVGGLVATAFAGPRRFGSGTLKDLLVGCSYVRGDGLIAKAGGMVVKNVSGFEIPRLLHGSWGTLAVLTSANFKVTPIPKGDITCTVAYPTVQAATEAAQGVLLSGASAVSCEIQQRAGQGGETELLVRIQGREDGVREQLDDLRRALGNADVHVEHEQESRAFWQQHVNDWASAGDHGQLAIGARPRDIGTVLATLEGLPTGLVREWVASPGTGAVRVRFSPEAITPDAFWSTVTPAPELPGISMMIEFAPASWKRAVDVWGTPPASLGVMQAIKRQFDPEGVLNRHRMMV